MNCDLLPLPPKRDEGWKQENTRAFQEVEQQVTEAGLGRRVTHPSMGRVVAPCPAMARAQPHAQLCFVPEPDLLWEMARETKSPKPFLQEARSLLH
jgi:hypothetical protein